MQEQTMPDLSSQYGINYQAGIDSGVPLHTIAGLHNYVENKCPPGSFLCAVLENNLHAACSRADQHNSAALPLIVGFMYAHLPVGAWGSPTVVKTWLVRTKETK